MSSQLARAGACLLVAIALGASRAASAECVGIELAAPNTHFVILAQAILYRGAGLAIVWPHFAALAAIGAALFALSLARFRRTQDAMG